MNNKNKFICDKKCLEIFDNENESFSLIYSRNNIEKKVIDNQVKFCTKK